MEDQLYYAFLRGFLPEAKTHFTDPQIIAQFYLQRAFSGRIETVFNPKHALSGTREFWEKELPDFPNRELLPIHEIDSLAGRRPISVGNGSNLVPVIEVVLVKDIDKTFKKDSSKDA